jgi:Rrf2 family protein
MGGAEIASQVKIPPTYITIIMAKLKKAGFISAKRGQIGGYCIAKAPSDITMWDIIKVMERSPQLGCCVPDDYSCAYLDISQCPIRKAYADAQTNMEEEFRHTTLEDLSDRMPD